MPTSSNDTFSGPTTDHLRGWEQAYAQGEERPLGSYALLLGTYLGSVGAAVASGRRRKVRWPERIGAADLALLTIATFRASRLVTKDSVTAVARAAFTEFEGPAGHGEVNEKVVGRGPRHAVGELVSCPFCISVWVATAGVLGLALAPRATRMAASALAATAGADALQFAFSALADNA